jgi:hypothetical protein
MKSLSSKLWRCWARNLGWIVGLFLIWLSLSSGLGRRTALEFLQCYYLSGIGVGVIEFRSFLHC